VPHSLRGRIIYPRLGCTCAGADAPLRELLTRTLICDVDPSDALLEVRRVAMRSACCKQEAVQLPGLHMLISVLNYHRQRRAPQPESTVCVARENSLRSSDICMMMLGGRHSGAVPEGLQVAASAVGRRRRCGSLCSCELPCSCQVAAPSFHGAVFAHIPCIDGWLTRRHCGADTTCSCTSCRSRSHQGGLEAGSARRRRARVSGDPGR